MDSSWCVCCRTCQSVLRRVLRCLCCCIHGNVGDQATKTVHQSQYELESIVEPETEGKPEPEATHESEPDAVHEPGPEAVADPEPEGIKKPEPVHQPELVVVAEPQPQVAHEPEPEAAHEPEPKVTAEPEPEPETAYEPKPEAAHEPEPIAVAESKPEAVHEPELKAVAKPEPKATAEPEPEGTAEPEAIDETERAHEHEVRAAAEYKPEAAHEPNATAEPEPEAIDETEPAHEHDVRAAAEYKPEAAHEPNATAEPEPEAIDETEPAHEHEVRAAAEYKPEAAHEPNATAESEPEAIDETEPALEHDVRAAAESKLEAAHEPELEIVAEPEPEAAHEPEPKAVAELAAAYESKPKAVAEPEAAHEPEPEPAHEPESEPEVSAEPEPAHELEPAHEPEPDAIDEPEPEAPHEPEHKAVAVPEPEATHEPEPSGQNVARDLRDDRVKALVSGGGVEENIIEEVQNRIGREWKELGWKLLGNDLVEQIQLDNRDYGVRVMVHELLHKWQQLKPESATVPYLADHLEKVGRRDIAIAILQLYTTNTSSSVEATITKPCLSWTPERESRPIQTVLPEQRIELICNQQEVLKPIYENLQLAALPWEEEIHLPVDECYVDIKLIKQDRNGRVLPEENDIHELLKQDSKNIPRRILVEGSPGYGKTSLVSKIAHDWAKGAEHLSHFDLVLFLQLRQFKGNLEDMIIQAAEIDPNKRDVLLSIFYDKTKNVLLLLDGYDELSEDHEETVQSLLAKDLPSHVIVVVTSRPGKFTTTRKRSLKQGTNEIIPSGHYFLHKRVTIKGLTTDEEKSNFIDRQLDGYTTEEIERVKLKLRNTIEKEYLECPFFLLMFTLHFLNYDISEETNCTSKTDLFKHVFNSVMRRNCAKNEPDCPEVDLFDTLGSPLSNHVRILCEFGKFALGALKSKTFVFKQKEIQKHGLDRSVLGFLKQTTIGKGHHTEIIYEPAHVTLLEFAAAFYLWVTSTEDHTDEWKKQIITSRPNYGCVDWGIRVDWSYLFPFLVGLFQTRSGELFQELASYTAEYSSCFGLLAISLMQTEMTDDILQALTPFLPQTWNIPWCDNDAGFSVSSQHDAVIRHGINKGRIKCLIWEVEKPFRPSDLPQVETLEIVITSHLVNLSNTNCNNLRCSELLCTINMLNANHRDWNIFLALVSAVSYNYIAFHFPFGLSPVWLYMIHNTVTKESLLVSKIRKFSSLVKADDSGLFSMIRDLIGREKIIALQLALQIPVDSRTDTSWSLESVQCKLDELVLCSAKCSNLQRFILTHNDAESPFTIDLAKLSYYKTWDYVELEGVKVRNFLLENPLAQTVKCLMLPSKYALDNKEHNTLQFGGIVVSHSYTYTEVDGLRHYTNDLLCQDIITEVHVRVDESFLALGLHGVKLTFKDVHTISLGLPPIVLQSTKQLTLQDKDKLLVSESFISLKRLEIWYEQNNHESASVLVCCVKDFLKYPSNQQQLKLKVLCMYTGQIDERPEAYRLFLSLVSLMKDTLVQRQLPKLEVVCTNDFSLNMAKFRTSGPASWFDVFPPSEGFVLHHHLWGSRDDDPVWAQKSYESPNKTTNHVYSVTTTPL